MKQLQERDPVPPLLPPKGMKAISSSLCELLMLLLHCAGRVLTGVSMIVCFALGFHFLLFEYFSTAPCMSIFSCTVLDREEPKIS